MSKNTGCLVETKHNKKGRTFNTKRTINGKVSVYIDGEEKPRLCDPASIKLTGLID